jgi:hypothetical protein
MEQISKSQTTEEILTEGTAAFLIKVAERGKAIRLKRKLSNTRIDFLVMNGSNTQELVNILNDQHLLSLKEKTGFPELKFITLDNLPDYSPVKLKSLMNLELILPLNTDGEVLDKQRAVEDYSHQKGLQKKLQEL